MDFDFEVISLDGFHTKVQILEEGNRFTNSVGELLCEFTCYGVPSTIPGWVNVENRVILTSHKFTIDWLHPELTKLWNSYLAVINVGSEIKVSEIELNKFDLFDPEEWFTTLLVEFGFAVDNPVKWRSLQFTSLSMPYEIPDWIKLVDDLIEPQYICTIHWLNPNLSSLWQEHLFEVDEFESSSFGSTDLYDPDIWLKNLLYKLDFAGIGELDWYTISQRVFPLQKEIIEFRWRIQTEVAKQEAIHQVYFTLDDM